jgi:2-keto-4-pentenoate hydratase
VAEWAGALEKARRTARPVDLHEELGGLDGESAYAVQRAVVARRTAASGAAASGVAPRVVGFKIGWADPAARERNGVPEPIFGRFLAEDVVPDCGSVEREGLIRPAVEGEFVVIVERELDGAEVTAAEARGACRLSIGFDLFDSRLVGGAASWMAAAADNGGAGRAVVADCRAALPGPGELAGLELVLWRDGEIASGGTGTKLDPDPAATVAWLARKLAEEGQGLHPGQFVFLGAVAGPVPLGGGGSWELRAEGLGRCRVEAVEGKGRGGR